MVLFITMRVTKKVSKNDSPLSTSDLKRLEEVFFSPPREKKDPVRSPKNLIISLTVVVLVLFLSLLFYFKYTVLIVPRIPASDQNLLSNNLLSSIVVTKDTTNMQFSQGVLYLSLKPSTIQEVTLNTREPIDLEKNNLFLHLSLIDPNFKNGDVTGTVIMKNSDFFSNAFRPVQVSLDDRFLSDPQNKYFIIPVHTSDTGDIQMNFSQITQVRIGFTNQKDKPVSLLVREINLAKKEAE